MPTTAHAHCGPYWEQEVSLLLKLLYYFSRNYPVIDRAHCDYVLFVQLQPIKRCLQL